MVIATMTTAFTFSATTDYGESWKAIRNGIPESAEACTLFGSIPESEPVVCRAGIRTLGFLGSWCELDGAEK